MDKIVFLLSVHSTERVQFLELYQPPAARGSTSGRSLQGKTSLVLTLKSRQCYFFLNPLGIISLCHFVTGTALIVPRWCHFPLSPEERGSVLPALEIPWYDNLFVLRLLHSSGSCHWHWDQNVVDAVATFHFSSFWALLKHRMKRKPHAGNKRWHKSIFEYTLEWNFSITASIAGSFPSHWCSELVWAYHTTSMVWFTPRWSGITLTNLGGWDFTYNFVYI